MNHSQSSEPDPASSPDSDSSLSEQLSRQLSLPTEELIVLGGDSRMTIQQESGLNKYGCSPDPRDVFALGSCTSSSATPRAYGAATEMKYWLKLADERGMLHEAVEQAFLRIRQRLKKALTLDHRDDFAVALTPSGTDVEILASAIALSADEKRLCNIISAPLEVGSGTVLAAGGYSFDSDTPRESDRIEDAGISVADSMSSQIDVVQVRLRNDEGDERSPEDLDRTIEKIVQSNVAEGKRVLLHVVAHTKTGAHAPRLATAHRLSSEYPDDVVVIVDAAQGRISRRGLNEALDRGYMVMFTGSKFFSGPPFSGALFVPQKLWPTSAADARLAGAAGEFFGAYEMPTEWSGVRALLPNRPNLGLMLRWAAAIEEIEAYYRIDAADRKKVLVSFDPIVRSTLLRSPYVECCTTDLPEEFAQDRMLESNTTVISFMVRDASKQRFLDADELREIFHWLNQDVSDQIDLDDPELMSALAQKFHIGQPVKLSVDGSRAVLRVALGSANVVTIVGNKTFGPDFEGRIVWFEHMIEVLRQKLEWIVQNREILRDSS